MGLNYATAVVSTAPNTEQWQIVSVAQHSHIQIIYLAVLCFTALETKLLETALG